MKWTVLLLTGPPTEMGKSESGKSEVIIRVQDTGGGVSAEQMEMIFEPFYTTKAAEQGTGLGLSITKKILDSLGGTVEIESELGKGSVVSVCLPFREKQSQE